MIRSDTSPVRRSIAFGVVLLVYLLYALGILAVLDDAAPDAWRSSGPARLLLGFVFVAALALPAWLALLFLRVPSGPRAPPEPRA